MTSFYGKKGEMSMSAQKSGLKFTLELSVYQLVLQTKQT